jgi:signal peptidase II
LTKIRDYLILTGIAGFVIALDQWSKYLVRTQLAVGEAWSPFSWLAPYVRVVHWKNTGAAFGLFPSGSLIFTVIAVIVSAAIIYYYPRVPNSQVALRFALALQLGGAIGNLVDRLAHGPVTDFISVGTFPVFNVADASISIGVAVLVGSMWIAERRDQVAQAEAGEAPSDHPEEDEIREEQAVG